MAQQNRNRAVRALIAAAVCAAPVAASAQATAEQTGVRIGSGRLNPVFTFETRYDSAAGVVNDEVQGDTILHIRPGVRFLAPSSSLQLKLDANYDYNAFLSDELSDLSKSTADVDFGALFNRDGDVQFEITDRFVRSDRTDVYSVGLNSVVNTNDAALRLITRSGDSWSITPSYTLGVQSFEAVGSTPENLLERYDNMSHTGRVDARLSVAPKTALLLDVGVGYRSYTGDETVTELADDVGNMSAQVGVTSMLGAKLGATVKLGYGSQFGLEDADDGTARGFGGFVGSAELGWYPTELSSVRVGYGRTFNADPTYDFYSDNRIYLESALAFTREFGLRAGLSYDMIAFGTAAAGETVDGGTNDLLRFHVGPEYRFNRWFGAGVSYAFTKRDTEGEQFDNPYYNYDRNELSARISFLY